LDELAKLIEENENQKDENSDFEFDDLNKNYESEKDF